MRKRIYLILLLTVLFLLSFSACSSKNEKERNADNSKGNNTLKIYYTDKEYKVMSALRMFKEKYKDIYNVEEKYFQNTDEYKNKITIDILSGEGPDVVVLRPAFFESVNKLVSNMPFCDINEFIKKDTDFKMSDYNQKVLDSFEQNGKRFMIPLRYAVTTLITSKEAFERNNIKIDPENWNYKQLVDVVQKYMSNNNTEKKYFFDSEFGIMDLIKGSGVSFIDFKNKKSSFDSNDFIGILEIYKKLYPAVCPEEVENSCKPDEIAKNDIRIMTTNRNTSPASFSIYNSFFKSLGEEMKVYPFPTLYGGKNSSTAYCEEAIAINNQSKNKDAAYKFIKVAMSEKAQTIVDDSGGYGFNDRWAVPINKKAFEADFQFTKELKTTDSSKIVAGNGSFTYSYSPVPLAESYKPVLDNLLSQAVRCEIPEEEISKIIKEEMPGFLEGKKTVTQTAKAINDKVNLYLNE